MAPNKIIFQIGVLAFCVTAVFLGAQNVSLMDTISRSFIVFVGVILTMALALMAGSMFMAKGASQPEHPVEREKKPVQREALKGSDQTTGTR